MRTHKQIIQATGAQAVIDQTGLPVTIHTVRSWQQRGSIPMRYWAAIADAGIAPLSDLAHAADARKGTPEAEGRAA